MGMETYNVTTYAQEVVPEAPLYIQAILLPLFSFPAWILCLPPLFWHFRQGNVAAGSLITWIALNNFFNSINPLIWPRDNSTEWWNGYGWCDIHSRIQVGSVVGLAASTAMIVRRLVKVMDTRNITVSSSQSSKVKAKIWEVVWCWGYPLIMILIFYIVQPVRYMLYGIMGCQYAQDSSWLSIVLHMMWGPITMAVAAYYAGLLIYRLYRYRLEFHCLLLARKSTSSRFIRLFILSMIVILLYLPYSIYLLVELSLMATNAYSWSQVHDPAKFNTIIKIPVFGQVSFEKWVQVGTGYIIFLLFGTGSDAHNLYKKMLVSVGAGQVWPSLYIESAGASASASASATPSCFITARTWSSSRLIKVKNMFWLKTESCEGMESFAGTTPNNSVVLDVIPPQLHNVTTEDTMLKQQQSAPVFSSTQPSFLKRIFSPSSRQGPVLPIFSHHAIADITTTDTDKSVWRTPSPGVHAHVWASDDAVAGRFSKKGGVHILREVHQDCQNKDGNEKQKTATDAWV
ncbi:STE3-domain-containing protein [Clathrospora elynae]|uniref:STE3-domain-containing protein n=1 Tax=Clathrospora elynae TaxID=706981 RepID=A0A6A5T4N7_9PLEO|nr:STE3-domain-containing protein [Clathrospora elynae]